MEQKFPKICGKAPAKVELEAGVDYCFCPCGLSANQPFCDGAHKKSDSGYRSLHFTPEKSGTYFLCMCKHTKNRPYRIVFIHAASPGLRLAGGFFCLGNGARCDEFFPTAAKRGIKCDQLGDGIGFGDHKVVLARGKFAFGIKNGKVILFACIE